MLITGITRDEMIILGIIWGILKFVIIGGATFLFGLLFFASLREAREGSNLFAFALVFGTLSYLEVCGLYTLVTGFYRPSSLLLTVIFFLAVAFSFNRIELINPLLDAMLLGVPLALAGAALIGGLQLVYTTGSFPGHLRNWILTCGGMAMVGAIRNYVAGR